MGRAITLTTLIFICLALLGNCSHVRAMETQPWLLARHRKPTKLTTKIPLPNKTTLIVPTTGQGSSIKLEPYHPAAVQQPRLIERYDKRALDGHYEYRYVLSNGDVRYERAYWLPVGHTKVLARKGYYSYPLPNHRFHTVFYTADHNGFREEESSYTRTQPVLPRRLEISMTDVKSEKSASEKSKNKINGKPNWTPVTTTILQKGRIAAATQATSITSTESQSQSESGWATGMESTNDARASTTITSHGEAIKSSASGVTNRPQINIEDIEVTGSKAAETAATTTTATTMAVAMAMAESPEGVTEATRAISASNENESINSIKAASVQTESMTTKTEQPEAIDTTTVLSVD